MSIIAGLMKRGPLEEAQKARAGTAVHYIFGALWGGVYALCRESFRTSPTLFGATCRDPRSPRTRVGL